MARRPPPPTVKSLHLPAPIGGVNTVDVGSSMPATDAVYAYNLVAAEYGLRSRLGYQEWVTGLTGATDNLVRSVVPFVGSRKSGATNKHFATTSSGIWDVSASTASPTLAVSFGTTTGDAGYGVSCVVSTPAGRFLVYCDEENGLYTYSENSTTWTKVAPGTTQLWAASTAYASGNRVANGGNVYSCSVAGTSGTGAGPTGTGASIADGTATWAYVSAAPSSAIGPSLKDQQLGYTADPGLFCFPVVFKNRLWLVEKDTTRAWYGDVNALFGTFTSFDFGSRMKSGGPLVGLYNWSYDAGNGMDSLLVGLSGAGDVVIYQGTDPTSASTFGLKGTWNVGGVPAGRRIATDYGGDLLVLSLLGVVPLSKLVVGQPVVGGDRSLYATGKIANAFNLLVSSYKTLQGWALHVHPTDNVLLVTVPSATGQSTTQLAMSFATRGWTQYRNLPVYSAGVWDGQLYFGTTDGRVCVNSGYVDGVLLADASAYTPVAFSLLTAFQDGGRPTVKRVHMLRPIVLSQSPNPVVQATARFDFNLLEPDAPTDSGSAGGNTFGSATWDTSVWGGDYSPSTPISGATGMGRAVAIAVRGSATTRTTLVGVDVHYDEGGLL